MILQKRKNSMYLRISFVYTIIGSYYKTYFKVTKKYVITAY